MQPTRPVRFVVSKLLRFGNRFIQPFGLPRQEVRVDKTVLSKRSKRVLRISAGNKTSERLPVNCQLLGWGAPAPGSHERPHHKRDSLQSWGTSVRYYAPVSIRDASLSTDQNNRSVNFDLLGFRALAFYFLNYLANLE